jgi:hypothetical protein
MKNGTDPRMPSSVSVGLACVFIQTIAPTARTKADTEATAGHGLGLTK